MSSPLPRTAAVIERGIAEGLHLGAQGWSRRSRRMAGNERHYRRFFELARALYVDLGVAAEDDPGREKELPRVAGMATA